MFRKSHLYNKLPVYVNQRQHSIGCAMEDDVELYLSGKLTFYDKNLTIS